jgi:hypothetical protein
VLAENKTFTDFDWRFNAKGINRAEIESLAEGEFIFNAWGDYLGDPSAMAFLDRVVDGAIIMKINGKSYRAHRAHQASSEKRPSK